MNKKAFTLAEVLITLSILGVVAALTIPALVNRNSDIAAQTKLKKAIAAYETFAAVYMAENEAADLTGITDAQIGQYFKQVTGAGTKSFTTADGAYWEFGNNGNAVVTDAQDSPRYGVILWNANGQVNQTGKTSDGVSNIPTVTNGLKVEGTVADGSLANGRHYSTAGNFMNGITNCKAAPVIAPDDGTVTCEKP